MFCNKQSTLKFKMQRAASNAYSSLILLKKVKPVQALNNHQ